MRELLLLRHGKSDWSVEVDDFQRPLKKRGRRGAEQIGEWLLGAKTLPDWIISSPAERAITTTQRCCLVMGIDGGGIHQDRRIYPGSLHDLLTVLSDVPDGAGITLLVGHNPGLEDLLEYLSGEPLIRPADGKLLPTASLASVEMPQGWGRLEPGCGRVSRIIRSREL